MMKRPSCRQEKKIYHVNLLKKWHPSCSSSVIPKDDEHKHSLEEHETEYLLETMAQTRRGEESSKATSDRLHTIAKVVRSARRASAGATCSRQI